MGDLADDGGPIKWWGKANGGRVTELDGDASKGCGRPRGS
jgi:hypothetical protein